MADCVVLASGSGSNFEAIATRLTSSTHRLLALICDRQGAAVLERAARLGVPARLVDYSLGRRKAEEQLAQLLVSLDPDLIVLAGFMRILPGTIVDAFPERIINIHPALLPAYPGMHAIERSWADQASMGVTVHLVDRGVDTGPVLARWEADRSGNPSLEEMEARIHKLEHLHYPLIVERQLNAINREGTRKR